jgi:hypothetical protein
MPNDGVDCHCYEGQESHVKKNSQRPGLEVITAVTSGRGRRTNELTLWTFHSDEPYVGELKDWCPGWDLNPHSRCRKKDFKSFASADFATRALPNCDPPLALS